MIPAIQHTLRSISRCHVLPKVKWFLKELLATREREDSEIRQTEERRKGCIKWRQRKRNATEREIQRARVKTWSHLKSNVIKVDRENTRMKIMTDRNVTFFSS